MSLIPDQYRIITGSVQDQYRISTGSWRSLPFRTWPGSRLSGVGHPEVVYLNLAPPLLPGMNTYDRWAGPTDTIEDDSTTTDDAPYPIRRQEGALLGAET